MRPPQRYRTRLVLAAAAAALVLGVGSTFALAATGVLPGRGPAAGWYSPGAAQCGVPALPGRVVDVRLTDMGPGMMGGPGGPDQDGGGPGGWGAGPGMGAMRLVDEPGTVPAGTVSLRVFNAGTLRHEVVVLPLPAGQGPGARPVGADDRVSEAGSLGEASRSCGAGEGGGIRPGAAGWTTLALRPGRYELVCNIPGHYAAGMYAELDVTAG